MAKHSKQFGRMGAIAAICVLASWNSPALAQDESSLMIEPPEAAMPMPADAEPMPLAEPAAPPAIQLVTPRIAYRTHLGARRMLRRNAPVNVSVVAEHPDPCVNCAVEVPLCITCCCTGEPVMTSHCGLLGRGVVEYCWSCGFSATVVFRARGDVVVHYRG